MIRIPFFWKLSLTILAATLLNLPSVTAAQTKQKVPPALTTITAEFSRVMTRVDALISQTAAEISDTDKGSPESRQKVIDLCRDLSLALYCAVTDADGTVTIGEPAETF